MYSLYKLSSILYKLSVETPDWIPPDLKKIMDKVDSIEKNPQLQPFKIELDKEFVSNMPKILSEGFLYSLFPCINRMLTRTRYVEDFLNQINKHPDLPKFNDINLKSLMSKLTLFKENLNIEGLMNNTVIINGSNLRISRFYSLVRSMFFNLLTSFIDYCNKINDERIQNIKSVLEHDYNRKLEDLDKDIPDFEKIPNKQDWDKRGLTKNQYYMVFSTDYVDILGMSSRSTWTSCQDVRPEKISKDPNFYNRLAGSASEPNVGIIYITDGSQSKYGETMIFRSVVWLILDKNNDKQVLSLQKIYPFESKSISDIFKEELKKRTGLDVVNINLDALDSSNYISLFSGKYSMPYDDVGLKNQEIYENDFPKFVSLILTNLKNVLSTNLDAATTDITNSIIKNNHNITTDFFFVAKKQPGPNEVETTYKEMILPAVKKGIALYYHFVENLLKSDETNNLKKYLSQSIYPQFVANQEYGDIQTIDNPYLNIALNRIYYTPEIKSLFHHYLSNALKLKIKIDENIVDYDGTLDLPPLIAETILQYFV